MDNTFKVLNPKDVRLLKDKRHLGMMYDEWQDWEEALEEIGHKYISEEDEYKYYECELEDIPLSNCNKSIKYIDDLIYSINKYHYCI